MGTFGKFETRPGDPGRNFPSGSSLYDARLPGEADFRYVVKLVRRRAPAVNPTAGESAADRRVEEQQQLFLQQKELARPPARWAAVHDFGKSPDGAWVVLDKYEASLADLIEFRKRPLDARELRHVVGSAAAGLVDLRSFGSRAHGRLKPTNVFLSAAGKEVAKRPVVLSDLGPARDAAEPADVEALGTLLYLCATRRAFERADVAVVETDEWRQLGPGGRAWRELCARMVHPVPARRPTLDEVVAAIDAVPVPRRGLPWKYLVAASLAGLTVAVVWFTVWHAGNRALFQAYDPAFRGWARDTVNALRAPFDPGSETVNFNQRLRAKFTPRAPGRPEGADDRVADDPYWVARLKEWDGQPPLTDPGSLMTFDPRSAAAFREGLARVDALRDQILNWPELDRLAKAEAGFAAAGWAGPAAVLRESRARVLHPLGRAPPGLAPPQAQLVEVPDAILAAAELERRAGRSIDRVLALLARLRDLQAWTAGRTADPLLATFADAVAADLAKGAAAVVPSKKNRDDAEYINVAQVREDEARNLALVGLLEDLRSQLEDEVAASERATRLVAEGRWFGKNAPAYLTDASLPVARRLQGVLDWNEQKAKVNPLDASPIRDRLAMLRGQLEGDDVGKALARVAADSKYAADTPAPELRRARDDYQLRDGEVRDMESRLAALGRLPFPAQAIAINDGLADLTGRAEKFDLAGLRAEVAAAAAAAARYDQAMAIAQGGVLDAQPRRFERYAKQLGRPAVAALWAAWLKPLDDARVKRDLKGPALADHYDAAARALDEFAARTAPTDPPAGAAAPPAAVPSAAAFEKRYAEALVAGWPAVEDQTLDRLRSQLVAGVVDEAGTVRPGVLGPALDEARAAYLPRLRSVLDLARAAGALQERTLRCERFDALWPAASGMTLGQTLAAVDAAQTALRGTSVAAVVGDDAELKRLVASGTQVAAVEAVSAKLAQRPTTFRPDDRAALVRDARGDGSSPELRHNAWLVLRDLAAARPLPPGVPVWPITAEELRAEQGVRQRLDQDYRTRAQTVDAADWLAARQAALRDAGPPTLRRYVEEACYGRPPAKVAAVVADVLRRDVRTDFEVGEDELTSALSGPVKVALALNRTLTAAPDAGTPAGDRRVVNATKDELTLAAGDGWKVATSDPTDFWAPQGDEVARLRARYAAMAKQLKDQLDAPAAAAAPVPPPAAAPRDFAAVGPGLLGWEPAPLPGDGVVYRLSAAAAGGRPAAIAFAPVPGVAPTPGRPTPYLATTELSIGMVNALMASAASPKAKPAPVKAWNKWLVMAKQQEGDDAVEGGENEDRKGARDWSWNLNAAKGTGEMRPNLAWMMPDLAPNHYPQVDPGNKMRLPANAPGGNPTFDHPLHRIAPMQGLYLAAVAGCRLPTVAEFRLALASETAAGGGPPTVWNLRDQAFAAQKTYFQTALAEVLTKYYPDTDIFEPRGGRPAGTAANAQIDPAVPTDGVLWFCPVNGGFGPAAQPGPAPGRVFKHLIGNVAEMVYNGDPTRPGNSTDDPQRSSAWTSAAARVAVMGASALSPPQYVLPGGATVAAAPDVPFEADSDINKSTGKAKVAYADVGVRLAIDVPGGGGGGPALVQKPPEPLDAWFKRWVADATPWDGKPQAGG